MKVGIGMAKAVGPRDGIADYSLELFRALEAHRPSDLELVAFTGDVPIEMVESSGIRELTRNLHTRAPEREDGLDVYHCTAFEVPKQLDAHLFFTVYDLTFLEYGKLHTLDNKLLCLRGILRAALADATFVAISQATRGALDQVLALPDSRIPVVPPGLASFVRDLDPEVASSLIKAKFDLEGQFVLHVGTAEPRKNQRRLLDAHRLLPEATRREFPLVWAGGDGWMVDDVEDELGFRRLGRVSNEELLALYHAATVFAYPSLAEGFGLPVAEAMRCGVPVLTSDCSSLPEVVGPAAVLVDPYDVENIRSALESLLAEPERRAELSRSGRARAREFSWQRSAARLIDLYREHK